MAITGVVGTGWPIINPEKKSFLRDIPYQVLNLSRFMTGHPVRVYVCVCVCVYVSDIYPFCLLPVQVSDDRGS